MPRKPWKPRPAVTICSSWRAAIPGLTYQQWVAVADIVRDRKVRHKDMTRVREIATSVKEKTNG